MVPEKPPPTSTNNEKKASKCSKHLKDPFYEFFGGGIKLSNKTKSFEVFTFFERSEKMQEKGAVALRQFPCTMYKKKENYRHPSERGGPLLAK